MLMVAPKEFCIVRKLRALTAVATCTPNSIFTLDKNTAIREAQLRRIEASLVAMHQAEQALTKEKRSELCQPTHCK